ncbi:MAG TPA: cystathionine gamma-synthase [Acidimicrobiales bacterium]|nr:cystathionine gamma-synthase [Acidimicrobiales bacterium]
MDTPSQRPGFETRAIHAGQDPDPVTGSVVPAVHLATTFRQRTVGGDQAYEYARSGNPTRSSLEAQMASLEGARSAYAFASGLAAEDAVLRALVRPGDHMILPLDAYGGTFRLVDSVHRPGGIDYTTTDIGDGGSLEDAWRDETRLVWVETPSNPSLSIVDIEVTAAFVHARGATLVVDNTFATPYLQNPLALGADVVVHSTTKYLGGHSDAVGGLVVLDDAAVADRIAFLQNATGAVPGPWDSYLIQRGAKTLAIRMERHCVNAQAVAHFLESHELVATTNYPGLVTHPGHAVAARQMRGFGGIVSFSHAGGEAAALAMVARTQVFTLAESLGAVESLIEHPGRMTHAVLAQSPLAVDPRLVRLSVGIESVDDLLADLDQALGR